MQNYSVLIFDGSTKNIANVKKSDVLMGPDSKPRTVKSLAVCEELAFEVKPLNGKNFVLGGDNYVCLSKTGQKDCFLDIHISDFEKQSEHFKNNYKLYRSGVDFDIADEPLIDPYFIGLLLGDSCLREVPIKFTNADFEALEYVKNIATNIGLSCKLQKRKFENCSDIFVGSFRKRNNFLRNELEKLNLWGKLGHEKFIPDIYKFGSRNVKLAMLAGLIDSDGTCSKNNSICYDTTSKLLANDAAFLARSLEFGASTRKPHTRPNENWRPIYSVCIFGDFSQMPLLVSRKIPRPRQSNKNVLKTGFSIHRLKAAVVYHKLEFEGEDQHFLKSDFMVMKWGNAYEL
jgi:hypothetical protein